MTKKEELDISTEEKAMKKVGFLENMKQHFKRSRLYIILIIILLIWIYFLRQSNRNTVSDLEQQMVVAHDVFATQQEQLLKVSGEEYLGLMTKTFSWAIRSEMLKEDYDEVSSYIGQLIREKNVKEILVIDADGLIVAASNRKQEEQQFSEFYDKKHLQGEKAEMEYLTGNIIYLSSPLTSPHL